MLLKSALKEIVNCDSVVQECTQGDLSAQLACVCKASVLDAITVGAALSTIRTVLKLLGSPAPIALTAKAPTWDLWQIKLAVGSLLQSTIKS